MGICAVVIPHRFSDGAGGMLLSLIGSLKTRNFTTTLSPQALEELLSLIGSLKTNDGAYST
jgi:hypothetical protein